MASLEYSAGALDVLPLFHKKPKVIYVEGPDDVPFWMAILDKFGVTNYHIKPAGGSEEVEKYAADIIASNVDIIVARDAEFAVVLGTAHNHPRILYTYGHSIENTFFSSSIIAALIAAYGRAQCDYRAIATQWLDDIGNAVLPLLVLEIANAEHARGVAIMGDTCHRFLAKRASHQLSDTTINAVRTSTSLHFGVGEIALAAQRLSAVGRKPRWWVRGHFLTQAVSNFVRAMAKRESGRTFTMSHDSLYVSAIGFLSPSTIEPDDRAHLEAVIARLLAA